MSCTHPLSPYQASASDMRYKYTAQRFTLQIFRTQLNKKNNSFLQQSGIRLFRHYRIWKHSRGCILAFNYL